VANSENFFRKLLSLAGVFIIIILLAILFTLFISSFPAIRTFGIYFFSGSTWDPVRSEFGALPFLIGTLATSLLALAISIIFSLPISIFLGEYFTQGGKATFIKSMIELLAGVPSVIYGFWGLFVMAPLVRKLELSLGVAPLGVGIFTASLILAIMIIPYSASLAREVISLVPADLKEAAYSLGATRLEVIQKVILPYAKSGIIAGILLSLGRALGETMAVTMVIGNRNSIPNSIFSPANTLASIIANEFTEATDSIYLASLVELALVLFLVTTFLNTLGKWIIHRMAVNR
jgi:phosphate transport system permease protein